MKKLLFIAVCVLGTFTAHVFAQHKYKELNNGVTVISGIVYANNISVLPPDPTAFDLHMTVYMPTGDTVGNPFYAAERPLILHAHTGNLLPPIINGGCTGEKSDSVVVEMCTQFAKRGYVAVAFEYRLGWNPIAPDEEQRVGGILNAIYRAIQDVHSLVRWFKKDYTVGGNTYAIDTSRIVLGGNGTGGYVSINFATLNRYLEEVFMTKFLDFRPPCDPPNSPCPVVDTSISGDIQGTWARPWNIPNNLGYSSQIQMVYNMGGAVGDSTFFDPSDIGVPMVSFHVPSDPFAPYGFGTVTVPGTNPPLVVIDVSGSHDVIRIANSLGYNDTLLNATFTDPYSMRANTVLVSHAGDTIPHLENKEGLFPFVRPTPESAPWEWWDTTCVNHPSATNTDMSKTKALAYIDTVMGYLTPRIAVALGLDTTGGRYVSEVFTGVTVLPPVDIKENIINPSSVSIYPNPTNTSLTIHSKDPSDPILVIELYNATGQMVRRVFNVNITTRYVLKRKGLPNGLYMIKVKTKEGLAMKKVVFE